MKSTFKLRLSKGLFCLQHPYCWRALIHGIAPSVEHLDILKKVECDLILDVGANRGQFSMLVRLFHPNIKLHAYEPLATEASKYRRFVGINAKTHLHEVALGSTEGEYELHVSARPDSSSLLPIGDLQIKFYPETREKKLEKVRVFRLDTLSEHWSESEQAFLKIDVQGFELEVLRGAKAALRHCRYVYVECSELALYSGQAFRADVVKFLGEQGFRQRGRYNGVVVAGTLIQADYLFIRDVN